MSVYHKPYSRCQESRPFASQSYLFDDTERYRSSSARDDFPADRAKDVVEQIIHAVDRAAAINPRGLKGKLGLLRGQSVERYAGSQSLGSWKLDK